MLATVLAVAAGWSSTRRAALSVEDATACRAVVWVMQNAGYDRDEGGSIIPVDHRPDLTARAEAITAALESDQGRWTRREAAIRQAFSESAGADLIWQVVEGDMILRGQMGSRAETCERKLGLRL